MLLTPLFLTETHSEPETISEDVEDVMNYTKEDETIEQQTSEEVTSPQEDNRPAEVPRFKEGLISKFINFIKSWF